MLKYDDIIVTHGVKVPLAHEVISPKIAGRMESNRYEHIEVQTLRRILRDGDRVLELGAGAGVVSTVAGQASGVGRVVSVEANPALIPLIAEVHRLNGVHNVEVRNGVVSAKSDRKADFYICDDFWASSAIRKGRSHSRVERVPLLNITLLIEELDPTVVICDIEGGEVDLFETVDLTRVREILLELHPSVYGVGGVAKVVGTLAAKGLHVAEDSSNKSNVKLFHRRDPTAFSWHPGTKDWPIADPNVLIATCMKDEGPFILEWLAWHRAIGVTNFVIFSNDCTDGTDLLLDRLDAMGEVTHLPNPAIATGAAHMQPTALAYVQHMRAFREADFFISLDVAEFLNVRVGTGQLGDLFNATGPFDVLSLSELNHGANQREHFERGWVKDQFPLHETEAPGDRRARRGVKSIVRLSDRIIGVRNHRPDIDGGDFPVQWLDGSGRYLPGLQEDPSQNGIDVRGSYDLASLDHFALRSLDSFLVKMDRGDMVNPDKKIPRGYWRGRNRNEMASSSFERVNDRARAYHAEKFEADAALMTLHEACCKAHEDRIARLKVLTEFAERREWALNEAW